MSDRTEQARAEAERRVRDLFDRKIYGPANSAGYLVGHAEGVEWADANPQPHTITRDELDAFKVAWETADGLGLAGGRVEYAMKRIGIEVEDDDE